MRTTILLDDHLRERLRAKAREEDKVSAGNSAGKGFSKALIGIEPTNCWRPRTPRTISIKPPSAAGGRTGETWLPPTRVLELKVPV